MNGKGGNASSNSPALPANDACAAANVSAAWVALVAALSQQATVVQETASEASSKLRDAKAACAVETAASERLRIENQALRKTSADACRERRIAVQDRHANKYNNNNNNRYTTACVATSTITSQ